MRPAAALALLTFILLGGCFGGGDGGGGDDPTDEPGDMPTPGGDRRDPAPEWSPPPPPEPNQDPVLAFTVKDGKGQETNVSAVGRRLTIDATGTTDPEGLLSYVQMLAVDAAGNQTFGYLYYSGTFLPAEVSLDNVGAVNLTVVAVDRRGGYDVGYATLYANQVLSLVGNKTFAGGAPTGASAEACVGPLEAAGLPTEADSGHFLRVPFEVTNSSRLTYVGIEPVVGPSTLAGPLGSAEFALCLDGEPVAPPSEGAFGTGDAQLTDGVYELVVLSKRPGTRVDAKVVLHADPAPSPP